MAIYDAFKMLATTTSKERAPPPKLSVTDHQDLQDLYMTKVLTWWRHISLNTSQFKNGHCFCLGNAAPTNALMCHWDIDPKGGVSFILTMLRKQAGMLLRGLGFGVLGSGI